LSWNSTNSVSLHREPAVGVHFAVRRDFFRKIGGISVNLKTGADIEMSFKVRQNSKIE
jgi:hypothetical protein